MRRRRGSGAGLRWWGGLRWLWWWWWWCPRWLSGVWRHSSLVGLVVSVWVCLVTLAHLSLQPTPLLSRQPCRQGSGSLGALGALGGAGVGAGARTEALLLSKTDLGGTGPAMLQQRERGGVGAELEVDLHQPLPEISRTLTRGGGATAGISRWSKLPVIKVGPDQRVLLTNEDDVFDEADNDFVVLEDDAAGSRQAEARDRRSAGEGSSHLVGFSARGLSAGGKSEMSAGKETFFQSFPRSGNAALHPSGISAAEDAQETQLQRAPVPSRYSQADSTRDRSPPPPRPLDYPSTPPPPPHPHHHHRPDMRHAMNPHHPSRGVRAEDRNKTPAVVAASPRRSNRVEYKQRGLSQDSERSRRTRPQRLSALQSSDYYSSDPAQPQSHLTRKNHDTLKAESAIPARPQTSASRVDSGVGVAEKVLPLVAADTEDDAIAVGTRLKMDGFLLYAYNVTASDSLPLDREVPDTRPEGCPRQVPRVSAAGPVSVIICTHNEASSVLQRTVHSVLRHTPTQLLRDVIVVDDNSTLGDPARALEAIGEEIKQGRLQLLRTPGRQGLVRARLLGAYAASGKVLVFLDSHCECGPDWLPPLLHALAQDKNKIVSPYIDVIRAESFVYTRSPDNLQGAFNWRLEFGWRAIPLDDLNQRAGPHEPINTPVISGGLFAVDRQFFFDIGAYDEHMDIWGGENMELSFRVWMCGGKLEIVPCSRVGHVFRSSVPYSFPGDRRRTVLRNLARAARVWMDDYSHFFFAAVNMTPSYDVGDVTSREALRERLQCRPFQWYLQTVSSQLHIPSPLTLHYGQFKNRGSLLCLTASGSSGRRGLRLIACHGSHNQTVELMKTGELQVDASCVTPAVNKQLALSHCQRSGPVWSLEGGQLRLDTTDLCLTSVDNEFVHLQTCRHGDPFQLWEPSFSFTWPK